MDMVWSDTWMLVWRIDESGELGYVKGDETLEAAIVHYQNAGKNLIQFYVVRKEGMGGTHPG